MANVSTKPYVTNSGLSLDHAMVSQKERVKALVINKKHIFVLASIIAICGVILSINLMYQLDMAKAKTAIQNIEAQNVSLHAHTDLIYQKISDQYDYQLIKEVAKEQEMSIDAARVRSVDK